METLEYRELWRAKGWLLMAMFIGVVIWALGVWNCFDTYHYYIRTNGFIDMGYIEQCLPLFKYGTIVFLLGMVPLIYSQKRRYRLTDKGIEEETGIIGKHIESIPYRKIVMVTVSQTAEGRIFDYGRVTVEYSGGSAGDKRAIKMVGMRSPMKIKEEIERRMEG